MKANQLKKMIKEELKYILKEYDTIQEPEHDDCFITDVVRGGYDVSCGGKFIKHVDEMDEALQIVKDWQDENSFYPTVWYVDDHGGTSPINTGDGMIYEGTKKRWVATIDFYVFGENENIADQEVQQIISMIDEQYDNHPSVVSLVPQQFGKIGIGEANIPGEEGYIPDENKINQVVEEMIKAYKELKDSVENIEDYLDAVNDGSPESILKLMKNPKLKEAMLKYMQIEKRLNGLSPEAQKAVGFELAKRYYDIIGM